MAMVRVFRRLALQLLFLHLFEPVFRVYEILIALIGPVRSAHWNRGIFVRTGDSIDRWLVLILVLLVQSNLNGVEVANNLWLLSLLPDLIGPSLDLATNKRVRLIQIL